MIEKLKFQQYYIKEQNFENAIESLEQCIVFLSTKQTLTNNVNNIKLVFQKYLKNQLNKRDVEVKVWCHSCERWVTDDIQDCSCQCTCNFGEDSDYDCIYEEDINVKNNCPRNNEWSWQYEISEKQYESLED